MDQFPENFGSLHSADDFDLLSLGFLPQEEQPEPEEDKEPQINPLHDMDSLEFLLWVEQEATRELERRAKQAAGPQAPSSQTNPDQNP